MKYKCLSFPDDSSNYLLITTVTLKVVRCWLNNTYFKNVLMFPSIYFPLCWIFWFIDISCVLQCEVNMLPRCSTSIQILYSNQITTYDCHNAIWCVYGCLFFGPSLRFPLNVHCVWVMRFDVVLHAKTQLNITSIYPFEGFACECKPKHFPW